MDTSEMFYLLIGDGENAMLLGKRSFFTDHFDNAISFTSEEAAKVYIEKHSLGKDARIVKRTDKNFHFPS